MTTVLENALTRNQREYSYLIEHSYPSSSNNVLILTCSRAIKRKKTFEYLLNCSNKNFGKNVITLYLAVLKKKWHFKNKCLN